MIPKRNTVFICLYLTSLSIATNKFHISVFVDVDVSENSELIIFYIKPSISLMECVEDCKTRKRCRFINYIIRSNTCFLLGIKYSTNLTTLDNVPEKLTVRPGYLFGVKSEWDLEDMEECETCPTLGPCSFDNNNLNDTSPITVDCKTSGCFDPFKEDNSVVLGTQYVPSKNVKHLCSAGYVINITTTNIACCQENGTWTSTEFSCEYDCGTMEIENGQFSALFGTTEGRTATLTCNTGYIFSGASLVTCTSYGWDGGATCTPIDCGPPIVVDGQYTASSGTTFGMTVTLYCNPGYDFSGDSVATCTENGWDGSATCSPMDCGQPPPLEYGQVDTSGGTILGNKATFSCDQGYNNIGDTSTTCTSNGWDGIASCLPVDCGDPSPTYGSTDSSVYVYGSNVILSCDPGFTLWGSSSITCQADGSWSETPTCGCPGSNQEFYGMSCYLVVKTTKTWSNAKSYCESLGGHLADIKSSGEQAFIRSLINSTSNGDSHWLAGNDKTYEGQYRWSDNTKVSSGYQNWHPGQPDEAFGGEDCMDLIPDKFNYRWNDNVCTYKFRSVCQIDL